MTHALPRTNFNSSRLVRSLSGLSVADCAERNQTLADRLGQWLNVADAITLFAALNPGQSKIGARSAEVSDEGVTIKDDCARVRTALANAIRADAVFRIGNKAELQSSQPASDIATASTVDFSPYRRACLVHQRNMATGIGPLRTRVREALSNRSSALKQLAELDAALDQALGNHERELLATVPTLLEKRFEALRKTHELAIVDEQEIDDPDSWIQPGGWLARFGDELLDVLLAELDLRLQPVEGLIAEYHNECTKG